MNDVDQQAHRHLHRAAMLALRGHGGAEPNPLVGCVIVNDGGETVGWGYHREVGGPHAEIIALRRAGAGARGATAYCTLEPCNHHGRTGPCSLALIEAGVSRVIVARRDPWSVAGGGIERLRAAGIEASVVPDLEFPFPGNSSGAAPDARQSSLSSGISEPFARRLATGLPWVTMKWAQTADGVIALPASLERRWISSRASRAMVHRERGRVDALLTGIGTVLADDPLLTPRGVRLRRVHRRPPLGLPLRVVIDPQLQTPIASQLARTASDAPTLIACDERLAHGEKAHQLQALGVRLMPLPMNGRGGRPSRELPLALALARLAAENDVTHVLTEAGAGLMRRLIAQRLACETWTFTAAITAGDDPTLPHVRGMLASVELTPWTRRRRGDDLIERAVIHYHHEA